MNIKIVEINVIPERDAYSRQVFQETHTVVWLNLETGTCGVSQENSEPGKTEARFSCRELHTVVQRPEPEELEKFIKGPVASALLQRVLTGSKIVWDGKNQTGQLNADAATAWREIIEMINQLPESEFSVCDIRDWLTHGVGENLSQQTDEELIILARKIRDDALVDNVILDGNIFEHLKLLQTAVD